MIEMAGTKYDCRSRGESPVGKASKMKLPVVIKCYLTMEKIIVHL